VVLRTPSRITRPVRRGEDRPGRKGGSTWPSILTRGKRGRKKTAMPAAEKKFQSGPTRRKRKKKGLHRKGRRRMPPLQVEGRRGEESMSPNEGETVEYTHKKPKKPDKRELLITSEKGGEGERVL